MNKFSCLIHSSNGISPTDWNRISTTMWYFKTDVFAFDFPSSSFYSIAVHTSALFTSIYYKSDYYFLFEKQNYKLLTQTEGSQLNMCTTVCFLFQTELENCALNHSAPILLRDLIKKKKENLKFNLKVGVKLLLYSHKIYKNKVQQNKSVFGLADYSLLLFFFAVQIDACSNESWNLVSGSSLKGNGERGRVKEQKIHQHRY